MSSKDKMIDLLASGDLRRSTNQKCQETQAAAMSEMRLELSIC